MKQREDTAQNAVHQETLHQIKREVHEETRKERRERLIREMVEHAHDKSSASPDEMQLIVEATLEQRPEEFPSLLDIHGGDVVWAASKVVAHMIDAARNGDTMVVQRAMMDMESLAADIIHSPVDSWTTEG